MSDGAPAARGRVLAIDFGLKRVGAAISDVERRLASPLEVYERRTPALDERHYRELLREERVERVVVGLPVLNSGHEGGLATAAREFGAWLERIGGVPVQFRDERYTSVLAEELLREQGVKAARRKGLRDQVAAHLLLQAYLDAGCPERDQPPGPLDDRSR